MAEEKDDLTRLEDLSEYLHESDPEAEKILSEEIETNESEEPPESFPPEFSSAPTEEDTPDETFAEEEFALDGNSSEENDEDNWHVEETSNDTFDSPPTDNLDLSEDSEFPSTDFESEPFNSDSLNAPTEEEQEFETDLPSDTSFETEENLDANSSLDNNLEVDSENPVEQETDPNPELEVEAQPLPEPEDDFNSDQKEFSSKEEVGPDSIEGPSFQKSQEDLKEIKSFGESLSPIKLGSGANPPFSIIFKNIDPRRTDPIKVILTEYGLLNPQTEKDIDIGLKHNQLIISHISEYAAILLAHKLRGECGQIELGLSDEIRPSKELDPMNLGFTHKSSYPQNKSLQEDLEELKPDEAILISNSPYLENYNITDYLGLVTEHTILDYSILSENIDDVEYELEDPEQDVKADSFKLKPGPIYEKLANKLKPHARKIKGNAIINVQFHMSPLPPPPFGQKSPQFSLACTGNVVRVLKKRD